MNIKIDRNYEILRDAWSALDMEFEYESAPERVLDLVMEAKDLLNEACGIYEADDDNWIKRGDESND